MNIISASRRTDIPACYGDWFYETVNKGECEVTHPFTGKKTMISLRKEDVHAFVFWSKNYIPFEKNLRAMSDGGYKFYLNYTANNYPRLLENLLNTNEDIIENLIFLSGKYRIYWRYDPVYISDELDPGFHIKNFSYLCRKFEKKADRVIVNFIQEYPRVIKRICSEKIPSGYRYKNMTDEEKLDLALTLKNIANSHGLKLYSCTNLLCKGGVALKSHCVDKFLIEEITGKEIQVGESPTYPGCHCHKSMDIGKYGDCENGCIYCYAKK